jgi:hypothetical protein
MINWQGCDLDANYMGSYTMKSGIISTNTYVLNRVFYCLKMISNPETRSFH